MRNFSPEASAHSSNLGPAGAARGAAAAEGAGVAPGPTAGAASPLPQAAATSTASNVTARTPWRGSGIARKTSRCSAGFPELPAEIEVTGEPSRRRAPIVVNELFRVLHFEVRVDDLLALARGVRRGGT